MSDPRQPNNPYEAAQLARVAARDFEGFKRALLGNVQLYADIAVGRTCMGSPVLAENVLAEIEHEVDMLVRVAAGAGDPPEPAMPAGLKPLSSELRNDLERHAAWLQNLHLAIGTELLTWLVECPHYAALWKAQVDENARLRAGDRPPAPSERDMMPRVLTLVGGVLMLCDEIERTAPGLPTIDGKRLRVMAEEVRDAWGAVRPTPRAPNEPEATDLYAEGERIFDALCARLGLDPNDGDVESADAADWIAAAVEAKLARQYDEWTQFRAGAASPAAAPPQEERK